MSLCNVRAATHPVSHMNVCGRLASNSSIPSIVSNPSIAPTASNASIASNSPLHLHASGALGELEHIELEKV